MIECHRHAASEHNEAVPKRTLSTTFTYGVSEHRSICRVRGCRVVVSSERVGSRVHLDRDCPVEVECGGARVDVRLPLTSFQASCQPRAALSMTSHTAHRWTRGCARLLRWRKVVSSIDSCATMYEHIGDMTALLLSYTPSLWLANCFLSFFLLFPSIISQKPLYTSSS